MAVPPIGKYAISSHDKSIWACEALTCSSQTLSSCSKDMGTASIKWVLPDLIIWDRDLAFLFIDSHKKFNEVESVLLIVKLEILIAVGMTSFELWDILTSSLGCIDLFCVLLAISDMTSFIFIFVLVPEPVWNISIGKWSI